MQIRNLLGQVKVGTLLQFPQMRLRASDVAALETGTVLRLPLPKTSSAELRVGKLQLASAYPVRTGEHRGAQFEEEAMGNHYVSESVSRQTDNLAVSVN